MSRPLLLLTLFASLASAQDSADRSATKVTLAQAVRSTLAAHPLLDVQRDQVQVSRAARQQASSVFNLQLNSGVYQNRVTTPLSQVNRLQALQSGIVADSQVANLSQFQAGAEKVFRSGLIISPGFSMVRNADNLTALAGENYSHTGITVVLPMLRGRGYTAVGAQEIASSIEIAATRLDLSHTAAQLISNAAASYWNYLAAYKTLEISVGSEERGQSFVDNVQAFIDAGRSPRSDLNEVSANLADRSSSRIAAEQRLIAARAQLAYDMGLSSEDIFLVGDPSTPFPKPVSSTELPPVDRIALDFYSSEAFQRRADLLAAQRRIEEAGTYVVAAKNRLKPQINLSFSFGYNGLREGTGFGRWWQSPFMGVQGADATGGLTYAFAPSNDLASGQLLQANAQTRQSESRAADIRRRIRASLLSSVEGVRHQAGRVSTVHDAVEAFQSALAGQRERYRLGLSSIVDILTMEDRLTNALTAEVQAQLAYALALTDLRFSTGTILAPNDTSQTIEENILLTLPFEGTLIPDKSKTPQPENSRSDSK